MEQSTDSRRLVNSDSEADASTESSREAQDLFPEISIVEDAFKSTLDHVENILDELASDEPDFTYMDLTYLARLKVIEDWLENAAASLISWSRNVGLSEGSLRLIDKHVAISSKICTAFSDIKMASDEVHNAWSTRTATTSLPKTMGIAIETLQGLVTTIQMLSAAHHHRGPIEIVNKILTNSSPRSLLQSTLSSIADILEVPSACLGIYTDGQLLVDSFNSRNRPTAVPESASNLPFSSLETERITKALEETVSGEGAGDLVYGISHLAHVFIAALFCKAINPQNSEHKFEGLRWNTKVYEMLNGVRKSRGKPPVPCLKPDCTILEALLHRAFPPLTNFLFGYGGNFMPTEEDFLSSAAEVANEVSSKNQAQQSEYSDCNIIILTLLLQELYGSRIEDILQEHIITPFGLWRTTANKYVLDQWGNHTFLPPGYTLNADLSDIEEVKDDHLMEGGVEAVLFGCRSCINDVSKFFIAILKAFGGDMAQPLTSKAAKDLFMFFAGEDMSRSAIGWHYRLDKDTLGSESLNRYSRQGDAPPSYKLSTIYSGGLKDISVHYRGGRLAGFTSSVYIVPRYQTFVIAMSNVTGLLNFTDYACQEALQTIFSLPPRVDFKQIVHNELLTARKSLQSILQQDASYPPNGEQIRAFVGKYQHTMIMRTIEITEEGFLIQRQGGHTHRVKVWAEGHVLRVFPSTIDARYRFVRVEFRLGHSSRGDLCLIGEPGETYLKT